ncbi:DUF6504 family protein [Microtetraspora fusca]|uniref:DUF6504 family protein n=1 Tax=Microtetraspora fusca TaxID=1997 RepID=A0ABW6VES6_MICFU
MRRYDEEVQAVTEPDTSPEFPGGRPVRFGWRRSTYLVVSVEKSWASDREWWRDDLPYDAPPSIWNYKVLARSNRGQGILYLSYDAGHDQWLIRGVED